jgi:hypothetical protein
MVHSATTSVVVNVIDDNDNAPVFVRTSYQVLISLPLRLFTVYIAFNVSHEVLEYMLYPMEEVCKVKFVCLLPKGPSTSRLLGPTFGVDVLNIELQFT